MQERLITYTEVSKIVGISRSTLYEWIREDRFPKPVKLGTTPKSAVKFKLTEVMDFIETLPTQHY